MAVRHIQIVKAWIEKFVIGLNLCPFAKRPFDADEIRYVLNDQSEVVASLKYELGLLLEEDHATTIIIIQAEKLDFLSYLDLYNDCVKVISKLNLNDTFQLASFHPDYQFADADFSDQSNYTNRSPFPLIHILRTADVTRAIDSYGDTSSIYERNINLLNNMEKNDLMKLFS